MSEPSRITAYAQNTAHVREGLDAFARQFRNSPNLRAVLTAYLTQIQDLESALWALLNDTLDTAVGDSLDVFGRVVGQPRGTLADDPYRAILRAAIRARRSNGTAEDVIAVLELAVSNDFAVFAYLEGAASILVEIGVVSITVPVMQAIFRVLTIAKAGGVELQLIDEIGSGSVLFAFGDTDPYFAQIDPPRAFDDATSPGTAGYLAGVYA